MREGGAKREGGEGKEEEEGPMIKPRSTNKTWSSAVRALVGHREFTLNPYR
jgi:hypothetical protein